MLYASKNKYLKRKLRDNKCIMPPALTIGLFIALFSFIIITRVLIHRSNEEISIPAQSKNISISENSDLNQSEVTILSMLWKVLDLSNQKEQGEASNLLYYRVLEEHFSNDDVNMNSSQALDMKDKIDDMREIINSERQTDISNMSLDGRKIAIYIVKQVYAICGLQLDLTMEGNIEKITNQSGNTIFQKTVPTNHEVFQMNALIITIVLALTLFSICFLIAKKNQLFNKDVIYDEFDEERFA